MTCPHPESSTHPLSCAHNRSGHRQEPTWTLHALTDQHGPPARGRSVHCAVGNRMGNRMPPSLQSECVSHLISSHRTRSAGCAVGPSSAGRGIPIASPIQAPIRASAPMLLRPIQRAAHRAHRSRPGRVPGRVPVASRSHPTCRASRVSEKSIHVRAHAFRAVLVQPLFQTARLGSRSGRANLSSQANRGRLASHTPCRVD